MDHCFVGTRIHILFSFRRVGGTVLGAESGCEGAAVACGVSFGHFAGRPDGYAHSAADRVLRRGAGVRGLPWRGSWLRSARCVRLRRRSRRMWRKRSCRPTLESTAATGAPSSVEWTFPRKSWSRGLFQGTHFCPTTTSPFALVKPTPQSDTGDEAEALAG